MILTFSYLQKNWYWKEGSFISNSLRLLKIPCSITQFQKSKSLQFQNSFWEQIPSSQNSYNLKLPSGYKIPSWLKIPSRKVPSRKASSSYKIFLVQIMNNNILSDKIRDNSPYILLLCTLRAKRDDISHHVIYKSKKNFWFSYSHAILRLAPRRRNA